MAVVGAHSLQMEKTVARVQVGTGLEDGSALVGGCEWTILACGSGLSLLEGVGWMWLLEEKVVRGHGWSSSMWLLNSPAE